MSDRKQITKTPSLQTLAFILRNKELWPEDFNWDYRICSSCAIGLTGRLWDVPASNMRVAFGLSSEEEEAIFYIKSSWRGRHITPEVVADRIDKVLCAANSENG